MAKINVRKALEEELIELEDIEKISASISKRLEQLYRDKFPKICPSCQKVFDTREDYIRETLSLQHGDAVYDREFGVQEFRNCTCGTTMLVLSEDRRDQGSFGVMRRTLFDTCVDKLVARTQLGKSEAKEIIREIFREIIKRNEKSKS